jgi:hypothetical protein
MARRDGKGESGENLDFAPETACDPLELDPRTPPAHSQ